MWEFSQTIMSQMLSSNIYCIHCLTWSSRPFLSFPLVKSSRSFSHSWLVTGFVTRLTRRVSLVKQELFTLLEQMSSPSDFSGVHVTRYLVFYVYFVDHCFSFFFWPLLCLFFFDIRILITLWYPLKSYSSWWYSVVL